MSKIRDRIALIIAAVVVIIAGGTLFAVAAIPDSDDQQFHACFKNSQGQGMHELDVIDKEASEECASGWTEIIWSQTGSYSPAFETVTEAVTWTTVGERNVITPDCPEGKSVTGGGYSGAPAGANNFIPRNGPSDDRLGWVLDIQTSAQAGLPTVTAYAICANTQ